MPEQIIKKIKEMVVIGDRNATVTLVSEALEKFKAEEIVTKALNPAMELVGQAMEDGKMYVPEVLLSARAIKASIEFLKPSLLSNISEKGKGKVVIGTVEGDLHDIGKNLVATLLEGVGFKVIDLGIDVGQKDFIDAVIKEKPIILGMSALLSSVLEEMENIIKILEELGLRKKVKVMIGGAAVEPSYAKLIGADGYGVNAGEAVRLALEYSRKTN